MDIYDDEGNLDYEKARTETRATGKMLDERQRGVRLDEITTAAVIDIAASLSVIALEASVALGSIEGGSVTPLVGLTDDEPEEVTEATRDFLVVTDLVHVVGDTEPGEVVGLGFDQGEAYADVAFVGEKQERFYTRNLVRIIGDEAPEGVVEEIADAVAAEIPEDPDDDFEAPVKKSGKKGSKK